MDGIKLNVHTIKFNTIKEHFIADLPLDQQNCEVLKQIRIIVSRYNQPISILINNMALDQAVYSQMEIHKMAKITNYAIENHAMVTKYCVTDLKTEF